LEVSRTAAELGHVLHFNLRIAYQTDTYNLCNMHIDNGIQFNITAYTYNTVQISGIHMDRSLFI
jgi:hypothetical protein